MQKGYGKGEEGARIMGSKNRAWGGQNTSNDHYETGGEMRPYAKARAKAPYAYFHGDCVRYSILLT